MFQAEDGTTCGKQVAGEVVDCGTVCELCEEHLALDHYARLALAQEQEAEMASWCAENDYKPRDERQ